MKKTVTLVIPCYNEESRLLVPEVHEFLKKHPETFLCFVDDGSHDATFSILESIKNQYPQNVSVLRLERNSGKAEAVRQGMLHSALNRSTYYIGYWDADFAIPLEESDYYLSFEALQKKDFDFLMGCRLIRLGARIQRKWTRHFLGRVFATAASLALRLPVYDTQCGAKLIRREHCSALFKEAFHSRWIFDVELIARYLRLCRRKGFRLKYWRSR